MKVMTEYDIKDILVFYYRNTTYQTVLVSSFPAFGGKSLSSASEER